MVFSRNNLQTFFGGIPVRLVQTKGHNRAVHSREKSDSECKRSKVSTGGLEANSVATLLCGLGKNSAQFKCNSTYEVKGCRERF